MLLMTVILVVALALPCHAATGVTRADVNAAVNTNGSCQVTLDLQLHLDSAPESLYFPLPKEARSISVNGSSARTRRSSDTVDVNLTGLLKGAVGDFSLRIQYTLPSTVDYNEAGKLELRLPLLSGFLYPVSGMSFTVNLPGESSVKPAFFSGYYQQSIESDMTFSASGNTVTGSVISQLKDRETLVMTLEVSEDMFPQDPIKQWSVGIEGVAMAAFAVLALLYWLIFMRCAPLIRERSTEPPQGLAAGNLGSALTGQGPDLTLLVFSWAQLGYLLIQVEDSGRVKLHKRMDMGNERSALEVRLFRSLFSKRSVVDGTGLPYANLCRKAEAAAPDSRELYKRSTGNPMVLRILCALMGVMGGISLGTAIAGSALLGILLIAILAALAGISAWLMQLWWKGLHLHRKDILIFCLILCAIWLVIGLAAGAFTISLYMVLAQLLCGLLWAYGGRRTITGRSAAKQVLGLRSFLRSMSSAQAQRLTLADPAYFFTMAPCAMALGVLRPFAKRFGKMQLTSCPYLTSGLDGHMTALEWSRVMERTAATLDARQHRLPLERLLGR